MATQATEIFYITLKPGVSLEGSSPSAKTWQDFISTLSRQEGYFGFNYGLTIEAPNLLIGMIHWQTLEHHKKFMQTPDYKPFVQALKPLLTNVHLHHFIPTPSPPSVLSSAPIVEFVTFFKITPEFPGKAKKFLASIGTPAGSFGSASGEVVEEIVKHEDVVAGREEEGKGRAFVVLLGWESVEAHMEFRGTERFKENVGLISEGAEGREMYHIAFKTISDSS